MFGLAFPIIIKAYLRELKGEQERNHVNKKNKTCILDLEDRKSVV